MNKRTLRFGLKLSFIPNLALIVLAALDYLFWTSQNMTWILSLFGILLLALVVLLILDETPAFRRVSFDDLDEGPRTVIYPRTYGRR